MLTGPVQSFSRSALQVAASSDGSRGVASTVGAVTFYVILAAVLFFALRAAYHGYSRYKFGIDRRREHKSRFIGDGQQWTNERVTPSQPGPASRSRWMLAGLLAVTFGLGLFACVRALTDPQISRQRGIVVSIESDARSGTTICVATPSGGIGVVGGEQYFDQVCLSGSLVGDEPKIGACIVLEIQGESAALRVKPSDDC